jgi:hypothetical protein
MSQTNIKKNIMATPSKSVQCRDLDSVVSMYQSMKIPAFGIKQNGALNFKYTGEDLDEGARQLHGFLTLIAENESAAIYTLCLYEDPGRGVNERTPADLSFNFRLLDQPTGYMMGEAYRGGYAQIIGEIQQIKKELAARREQPEESKLGLIGEILELEPMQPLLMAIGSRLADFVMPAQKVGELKRVSGVPGSAGEKPGPIASQSVCSGKGSCLDPALLDAINRLSAKIADLPSVLQILANMAEQKPGKFAIYLSMIRKMK